MSDAFKEQAESAPEGTVEGLWLVPGEVERRIYVDERLNCQIVALELGERRERRMRPGIVVTWFPVPPERLLARRTIRDAPPIPSGVRQQSAADMTSARLGSRKSQRL